ncbi:hypothetical protein HK105_206905 [Polyrhizophydium stewartii]|uniref:RING-type E3 ubiquitin transferase n=1 Tax=Polyrhizophydium stewartii TaxID=2732419 RepID=A0ABR4N261_9FUNG
MASTGRTLLFLWLCFCLLYFFDPATKVDVVPLQKLLEAQQNESLVLGNMTYADNGTHFSASYRRLLADMQPQQPEPVFFTNLTGRFRENASVLFGLPDKVELSPAQMPPVSQPSSLPGSAAAPAAGQKQKQGANMPDLPAGRPAGDFNFADGGTAMLRLFTNATIVDSIAYIEGKLELSDSQQKPYSSFLHGIHFVSNGTLFLRSAPEDISDLSLHGIPKLMPDQASFNQALRAIKGVGDNYIAILQNQLSRGSKTEQEVVLSTSKVRCQFSIVMQEQPLDATQQQIRDLEHELTLSQGIWVIRPPLLVANMSLVSPNCDVAIGIPQLYGLKYNVAMSKSRSAAVFVSALTFVELLLTARQMQYTSSQSLRSKISSLTIAMMTLFDAYACIAMLTAAIVMQDLFVPFATGAFLKFCMFSVFEMRYLFTTIQARRRDSADVFEGTLLSRIYVYGFLGVFFFYQVASRFTIVAVAATFAVHSFWIPQIVTNVRRNSRRAFDRVYIYGMSATRVLLMLYIWGCPDNVFGIHEEPRLGLAIALQAGMALGFEHCRADADCKRNQLAPQTYDYHPVLLAHDDNFVSLLVDGDAENRSLPTASSAAGPRVLSDAAQGPTTRRSRARGGNDRPRNNECAICFAQVQLVTSRDRAHASERLNYMVTPCHHIFHTECLERWMEVKLECPVCRSELPPT